MAILDKVSNFAKADLAAFISSTDTSLTIDTNRAGRFPSSGNFTIVVWDAENTSPEDDDDLSGVEVMLCTGRSSNTLTLTRAQEGTTAKNFNTSGHTYKAALVLTSKMITDIDTALTGKAPLASPSFTGNINLNMTANDAININLNGTQKGWLWQAAVDNAFAPGSLAGDIGLWAAGSLWLGTSILQGAQIKICSADVKFSTPIYGASTTFRVGLNTTHYMDFYTDGVRIKADTYTWLDTHFTSSAATSYLRVMHDSGYLFAGAGGHTIGEWQIGTLANPHTAFSSAGLIQRSGNITVAAGGAYYVGTSPLLDATTTLGASTTTTATQNAIKVYADTKINKAASSTVGVIPKWDSTSGDTLVDGFTVGTGANNLVQLNASSQLPAVSGALLTGISKVVSKEYAYTISGTIAVPSGDTDFINGFFIRIPSGKSAQIVGYKCKINSGTSATVKLQKNGVDITGFTSITVGTTASSATPTAVTLADGDIITLIVTAISATPKNMAFTIFIDFTC